MKKETLEAIRNCKALQGQTIADICQTDEFLGILDKYMRVQLEERQAARNAILTPNRLNQRLPAHVIDKVEKLGLMNSPTRFANEWCKIINRESELSAKEREYVRQLGQQAFNLTVANFVIKENPELRSELYNTKNTN